MVSWFETTGLSTLEAAACGCSVVISKKGDQVEYFEENAHYAMPDDIESIKSALLDADKKGHSSALQEKILIDYNWDKTAEQTMKAYRSVLNVS